MPDYIALVRSTSSSLPLPAGRADAPAPTRYPGCLVFLHGDGVGVHDDVAGSAARVHVCRTSWRRRFGERAPDGRCVESSLAILFSALRGASRLDSFGLGGSACSRAGPDRDGANTGLLIELGFAPQSDRAGIEALELVLAAAALGVPARVLFTGAGERHLTGPDARGWRQLTDFDLLPLYVSEPVLARDHAAPAKPLDTAGVLRLRAKSRLLLLA
ncbi:MAG: hypothetical protein ACNS61_05720 [Candidatus Wenzhouxiangella sp. M2_3B_020]